LIERALQNSRAYIEAGQSLGCSKISMTYFRGEGVTEWVKIG